MKKTTPRYHRATAADHRAIEDAPTVVIFIFGGAVAFLVAGAALWDIARAVSPILLAELLVSTAILAAVTIRAMALRTDPQVGPSFRYAVTKAGTAGTPRARTSRLPG